MSFLSRLALFFALSILITVASFEASALVWKALFRPQVKA